MKYFSDFLTAEDHIKAEYSKLRAWVALNPYWAICVATAAGWLIGKVI